MTNDLIETRRLLEAKQSQLSGLRPPVITAQMRHAGLRTRPHRQEIVRYRKEILRQKQSYKKQIEDINKHLAEVEARRLEEARIPEEGEIIEPLPPLIPPTTSILKSPELTKTRILKTKRAGLRRIRWI